MSQLKIALASDHAGYEYKEQLKEYLLSKKYLVKDFGTHSMESADYPDFAHPLASAVEKGEFIFGITLCGSGNGISMTANKHQGIRSALCWNKEISELARLHNDANVCSIPARFVSIDQAKEIVDTFLTTSFEGGRHLKRVEKIPL
ncbi:MAG: ribose 5-phosphate isomerase B [Bacteroidetes bacterium GWF2_33_16]|nr:MAG: ribose 5-phosphate isomerase B [Bacteroidetes bacterium GWE2_32_14]OFY03428.1 MAG: ribose 5-phosphate isomerase B [Bacteroidetes bacterium GWF2_33_16]